jgi:hypothetical protein
VTVVRNRLKSAECEREIISARIQHSRLSIVLNRIDGDILYGEERQDYATVNEQVIFANCSIQDLISFTKQ